MAVDRKLIYPLCFTILIVLLAGFVHAAEGFSVFYTPIQKIITEDQRAIINVTVTNLRETPEIYNFGVDNDLWSVTTDPIYVYQTKYGLNLGPANTPDATATFQLYLSPAKKLAPGMYQVFFTLESNTSQESDQQGTLITIRNLNGFGEYLPAIRADVSVSDDGKIDPRKTAVLSIKLDNLNPLNITDLKISISGDGISKEIVSNLAPLEEKTEVVELSFDPLVAPATKDIKIIITINGEVVKIIKSSLDIQSYSELEKTSSVKNGLLTKQTTYTFKNNGNVDRKETIVADTSMFKQYFSRTTPLASVADSESGLQYRWFNTLKPQESFSVVVYEDYRWFVLALVAIIAAIILYYAFRSPILMKKEATIAAGSEDSGISEIKVLIYIQNRTRTQFRGVKVMDKIPAIAELKDEFIAGTLKPSKVLRNEKKGTVIEWGLQTVEPYEERIISYRLKSKLSILGLFNLPPSMVKYVLAGKERSLLSNKVTAAKVKRNR